jgi:putative transcriptional regulator
MVSRVKELREALNMSQKELSEQVNVSRQTIYHLEKGTYNPRMDLSLKLRETLGKPVEEIFSLEPIITDLIGKKTTNELEDIAKEVDLSFEDLYKLKNLDESELLNEFSEEQLQDIADAFGVDFEELFIE